MKKLLLSLSATIILSLGISSAALADTYKVKSGDTLWGVSKKYHVTVNQLKQWNKLSSDSLRVNQVLTVSPTTTTKPTTKSKTVAPAVKKEISVTATAYTASCKGCSGITATGVNLKKNPNAKVISVDPKVIPLGTKVYVPGYGYAIAADKGHAMKGGKIDVFFSSKTKAYQWGVRKVKIQILK
ncbi:3D domain-containing protein [Priestia koreensis]|uniref:LysM domain-containing protein n=1 Tax=Priestia koreensis TaxID=284581 RepID=A0A0M0KQJ7_9BACI|nr:3D domain-containing protein [Priestia koreensis]KOO41116.1 hypothetical protein AMD01_19415 [Priestia koreensis]